MPSDPAPVKRRKPAPVASSVQHKRGDPRRWELRLTYGVWGDMESTVDTPEEEVLAEADEVLTAQGYRREMDWQHQPGLGWLAYTRRVT